MNWEFEDMLKDFYEKEIKDDPEFEGIPFKHVSHLCKMPFKIFSRIITWGPISNVRMKGFGIFEAKEFEVRSRYYALKNYIEGKKHLMLERVYKFHLGCFDRVREFIKYADEKRNQDNSKKYPDVSSRKHKV